MGKRLLLVEDEATLARAITRLLRRRGHDVFLAGSCTDAKRATGTFSMGIFDIDLPDGDGLSLAERLLKDGIVRRAIFFSGTQDGAVTHRASALGPFVEKIKGFPALEAVIDRTLAGEEVMVSGAASLRVGESSHPPPSGVRKPRRHS
jgi:DNA-binding NtrC family response regulator